MVNVAAKPDTERIAIARGEVALNAKVASKLSRAFQALVEHLESLLRDVPHQPLYLFPYYRGLLEARRADRVHPADLFFPDLSVRVPEPPGGYRDIDAAGLAAARAGFERGLLQVMRGSGAAAAAGAALMREAIDTVGASLACAPTRAFWWVAQAWFEALAHGAIDIDARMAGGQLAGIAASGLAGNTNLMAGGVQQAGSGKGAALGGLAGAQIGSGSGRLVAAAIARTSASPNGPSTAVS